MHDTYAIDCLLTAVFDGLTAEGTAARARLKGLITDNVMVDAGVAVSRVRIDGRRFELDEEGRWAVLAPCVDAGGWVCDVAAFELDGKQVALLNGEAYCIGGDEISADHVFVHADVWSWLRSECCGVVPISWRRTALRFLELQVGQVLTADIDAGLMVDKRLKRALRPPKVFVDRAAVAA